MPTKSPPKPSDAQRLSQIDKFREAARELETDDREEAFDEKLKAIVKIQKPKGKPQD